MAVQGRCACSVQECRACSKEDASASCICATGYVVWSTCSAQKAMARASFAMELPCQGPHNMLWDVTPTGSRGVLRNTVVSQGLRGDLSPKTAKRLATAQGDVVQGVSPPSRTGLIPASTLRNWGHHACSSGAVPTRVGRTARALARPRLTPGWGGVLNRVCRCRVGRAIFSRVGRTVHASACPWLTPGWEA